MKKYLALTMAACMALSLAACGSAASSTTSSSAAASTEATSDSAATAEATGSDNITGIAQCCDVGTLDDESFNQGCWEAVKGYGDENGIDADIAKVDEVFRKAFQIFIMRKDIDRDVDPLAQRMGVVDGFFQFFI